MLRQNLELYDSYQRQIGTCDGEIESLLQDLAAKHALPGTALPPARGVGARIPRPRCATIDLLAIVATAGA